MFGTYFPLGFFPDGWNEVDQEGLVRGSVHSDWTGFGQGADGTYTYVEPPVAEEPIPMPMGASPLRVTRKYHRGTVQQASVPVGSKASGTVEPPYIRGTALEATGIVQERISGVSAVVGRISVEVTSCGQYGAGIAFPADIVGTVSSVDHHVASLSSGKRFENPSAEEVLALYLALTA